MGSVKLESVSPIVTVHDLSQLEFYQHTLGFDLAWSWGEPADIVDPSGNELSIGQVIAGNDEA